jgi:hypothetical protein
MRIFIPFATSYLCEAGFSAATVIKSKYRSKINVEQEMRVAVEKPYFAISFYFLARKLRKYSGNNSALYSLRSGLLNEVSLGIPFHLKKKVRGGC